MGEELGLEKRALTPEGRTRLAGRRGGGHPFSETGGQKVGEAPAQVTFGCGQEEVREGPVVPETGEDWSGGSLLSTMWQWKGEFQREVNRWTGRV